MKIMMHRVNCRAMNLDRDFIQTRFIDRGGKFTFEDDILLNMINLTTSVSYPT